MTGALTAVVALLVGVTIGVLLSGPGDADPVEGVSSADEPVVRLVDSSIAAVNAMDVDAVAAAFAEDAVFTDLIDQRAVRGGYNIALTYGQTEDFDLRRTSAVTEIGELVTFSVQHAGGDAVVVAELEDGRFTHVVVMAS